MGACCPCCPCFGSSAETQKQKLNQPEEPEPTSPLEHNRVSTSDLQARTAVVYNKSLKFTTVVLKNDLGTLVAKVENGTQAVILQEDEVDGGRYKVRCGGHVGWGKKDNFKDVKGEDGDSIPIPQGKVNPFGSSVYEPGERSTLMSLPPTTTMASGTHSIASLPNTQSGASSGGLILDSLAPPPPPAPAPLISMDVGGGAYAGQGRSMPPPQSTRMSPQQHVGTLRGATSTIPGGMTALPEDGLISMDLAGSPTLRGSTGIPPPPPGQYAGTISGMPAAGTISGMPHGTIGPPGCTTTGMLSVDLTDALQTQAGGPPTVSTYEFEDLSKLVNHTQR